VLVAGVVVGAGPFVEQGLDEAFGFAVCLRAAGAGVERLDRAAAAACFPLPLEVFAVVGQELFDRDAVLVVEAAAAVEEGERAGGCFVGVEGGVREAGVVVDADVEVVPAGLAAAAGEQAAVGVAGAFDAAEFLDVDVDELAGPVALVADDGFGGAGVEAGAAVAAQDRVHGRGGELELPADRVRPGLKPLPRPQHAPFDPRRRPRR